MGPTPYRGGDLEFQLALFTVESADLTGPFLDLLQGVSRLLPPGYAAGANAALATLRTGMDALKNVACPNILEVGLHETTFVPETGVSLLASPRQEIDFAQLRLESDGRVVTRDGTNLECPYVVFDIASSKEKDDWYNIPDISASYRELTAALKKGLPKGIRDAQTVFNRAVLLSIDLLPDDAERIVKLVRDRVDRLQGAGLTSGVDGEIEVPALRDLPLYASAS